MEIFNTTSTTGAVHPWKTKTLAWFYNNEFSNQLVQNFVKTYVKLQDISMTSKHNFDNLCIDWFCLKCDIKQTTNIENIAPFITVRNNGLETYQHYYIFKLGVINALLFRNV